MRHAPMWYREGPKSIAPRKKKIYVPSLYETGGDCAPNAVEVLQVWHKARATLPMRALLALHTGRGACTDRR